MNDIILPSKALEIAAKIKSVNLIQVIDDETNRAATENLKYMAMVQKEFDDETEPTRIELYAPYKEFLDQKKTVTDTFKNWIDTQKKEVGKYSLEVKAKLDAQRPEGMELDRMKTKTEFATSTVKEKAKGFITDKAVFLSALMETGNSTWINLIFDKVNESKLNEFCKASGLNGKDKIFPGLVVEMTASVSIR